MTPHRIRAFAPGRVNLIGEHTDYNDGLCLPFAIELGVIVTAELHDGDDVTAPGLDDGARFLEGTLAELRSAGVELPGATLDIEGDLPQRVGLSSSAALCIALALALYGAAETAPPRPVRLARLCSRVESKWAGQDTGLLDQLASLLGEKGRALRLDMRTLEARPIDLHLHGHVLATLDSGASRSLAASGYNERREECRRALELLGLESLRDADDASGLPAPLDARVRHVISENERVDAAVAALESGDLAELGALLNASHASLRDDYEVSVPEVERAVAACIDAGALGARIMGGGFGGSVLALFPPGAALPDGAISVRPWRGGSASLSAGASAKTTNRGSPARLQEPAHRPDRRRDRDHRLRAQLGRGAGVLMAEEVRVSDPSAEEAGEAIHLPGPSYLPVATAFGVSIAVVGVVLSWVIVGIGLVIAVIAIWRWIGETRRETAELPLEH